MGMANASLLDEGTAAAEAMTLLRRLNRKAPNDRFIVDADTHPQTIDVVVTRAEPLGIEVVVADLDGADVEEIAEGAFGVLVSYPGSSGRIGDLSGIIAAAHNVNALVAVATDLLALCVLTPPGELGADVVVGVVAAVRGALGLRRPPRRVHRRAGVGHALAARSPGRGVDRRRRSGGVPADPPDPRAAHPPGAGHQQHLHRPGTAGGDGRHVRRLPRPRRASPHRPTGPTA